MNLIVFSIHDSAANAFVTPFFMHTKAMAMRAFEDNVNSKEESNITKHPEQFSLFKVGEFSDENGTLVALEKPEIIATGLEVLKPTEQTEIMAELQSLKSLLATKGE